MEKAVAEQFTVEVLHEAARRFGLREEGLKELGKFENYVYEGEKDGIPYVLRLVHSSHRSENMVLGEMDWVKFLADRGVKVARPLFSVNNNLVEKIPVGEDYFLISLFEKAPGKLVNKKNEAEWHEDLFRVWGKTIGMTHRFTKEYQVPNESIKRPQWDEEDLLELEKYLPEGQEHIIQIGKELVEYLHTLPKNRDSYGLIHTDVHHGNFFYHEGEITVFDFDDCCYQWFISDIAIALFYTVWMWEGEDTSHEGKKVFAESYLKAFLEGYREENDLDDYWLTQMPYFLRLRDVVLYSVFHKKFDVDPANERLMGLLNPIKERIEKKVAIVEDLQIFS